MPYPVEMTKDKYYGNIATSSVSLGNVESIQLGEKCTGERVLKVRTSRSPDKRVISTFASVSVLVDSGRGYKTEITVICGDFTSRLGVTSPKTATAKEVARVHEAALLELPAVVESAKSFYAARAAV
jgi:hypothetical protein